MKQLLLAAALGLSAQTAFAAQIDPATTVLPWKNGPSRDARYALASEENANKVHVFEAWSITCSWCNRNAAQVKAMATEYRADERVAFIDLGLDTADRDYQRWISQHAPNYPVVQDEGRRVWNALRQENGIPQTFVVACDGTLVGHTVGYWGAAEKTRIKQLIERAKQTTCVED